MKSWWRSGIATARSALTTETKHAGFRADSDFVIGKAPVLELDLTDYGYRYAGIRALGERGNHIRTHHYVMPFHQMRPRTAALKGPAAAESVAGHMRVPIDDENCMIYNWIYCFGGNPISLAQWEEVEAMLGLADPQALRVVTRPSPCIWAGRFGSLHSTLTRPTHRKRTLVGQNTCIISCVGRAGISLATFFVRMVNPTSP